MRWYLWLFTLSAFGCLTAAPATAADKGSKVPSCGDYGTSVHFEKTPSLAATRAVKEEKLVCVLHVSGNFEDSEFT